MKMFKQLIVYILYYIGHFISKIMNKLPFLYIVYNYFMNKSVTLQEKWLLDKPWKKITDEEREEYYKNLESD